MTDPEKVFIFDVSVLALKWALFLWLSAKSFIWLVGSRWFQRL